MQNQRCLLPQAGCSLDALDERHLLAPILVGYDDDGHARLAGESNQKPDQPVQPFRVRLDSLNRINAYDGRERILL
jgi:hypothetical protein